MSVLCSKRCIWASGGAPRGGGRGAALPSYARCRAARRRLRRDGLHHVEPAPGGPGNPTTPSGATRNPATTRPTRRLRTYGPRHDSWPSWTTLHRGGIGVSMDWVGTPIFPTERARAAFFDGTTSTGSRPQNCETIGLGPGCVQLRAARGRPTSSSPSRVRARALTTIEGCGSNRSPPMIYPRTTPQGQGVDYPTSVRLPGGHNRAVASPSSRR